MRHGAKVALILSAAAATTVVLVLSPAASASAAAVPAVSDDLVRLLTDDDPSAATVAVKTGSFSTIEAAETSPEGGDALSRRDSTVTTVTEAKETPSDTTQGAFQILESVPHDPSAFTQGLCLTEDGTLYEGTGLWGQSEVRVVDLSTGAVMQRHRLDDDYFGEGLTYYRDAAAGGAGRLIQITWKARTGFVYDSDTLEELERFPFTTTNGQGWGITHKPGSDEFLVSDGTEYLHTWDMKTRKEKGRVAVNVLQSSGSGGMGSGSVKPLKRINELEWDPFTDTVLANVWRKDIIVRIDPKTGAVLTVYDLASLFTNRPPGTNVLNGITLTEVPGEVWVTGKLWPKMFRIRLVDP